MPRRIFSPQSRFRIGAALVQPDRLAVTIEGLDHALEPRVMEVLVVLAEQRGEVISAEQLLIEVWRGTFYGDNPVHKAINALRRVFGDDIKSPRCIETIRKRGYRLIAKVTYPDDYRRAAVKTTVWSNISPYVGLSAFDSDHASVFFGRSRATAELLAAMRKQIDHQRRFVLIVGASGCGKTSLLHAGAIPLLLQDGGFDSLRAFSVANCDLAGVDVENAVHHLAASLAAWTLGERPVFAPRSSEDLAASLMQKPESITATIDEAFRRHPSREWSEQPHAHLLLVIDHAETLVSGQHADTTSISDFARLLDQLCETPRVLVIMVVRGDFYLKLVESVPGIAERKAGDGHLDVLTPRLGEIAQIIRIPAAQAGLTFEEDPQTAAHLDDVLRDAAIEHPDALPLLQHTLQALYERRNEHGELGFDAYRAIGGLEGALAHRAEEVFASLPDAAQRSLDDLLAQMIVMQPENDSVSARRIAWSSLDDNARTLAETFIRARLFVAELGDSTPGFRVAHEALLRQWPRAKDWAQDNRRILQARVRLQRAAARWVEEGKKDDHLLNPGRPLGEALEVARILNSDFAAHEHEFLNLSEENHRRVRYLRVAAIVGLSVMTVISGVMALAALKSRDDADQQRARATDMTTFIIDGLGYRIASTGDLELIESVSKKVLDYCRYRRNDDLSINDLISCSRALRNIGKVRMEQSQLNRAEPFFRQSTTLSDLAAKRSPESSDAIKESGQAASWLGNFYYRKNMYNEAVFSWEKYLKKSEYLIKINPNDFKSIMDASYAFSNIGQAMKDTGDLEGALAYFKKSVSMKKRAIAENPAELDWIFELVVTSSLATGIEESNGDLLSAAVGYEEQVKMLKRLLQSRPAAKDWERQLASLLYFQSALAINRGDIELAKSRSDETVDRFTELVEEEPRNDAWRRYLAQAHLLSSEIARFQGNPLESRSQLDKALNILGNTASSPASWKRIDATIRFRKALLSTETSKEAVMQSVILELRTLLAAHNDDRHIRMALIDALLLRLEQNKNHSENAHYMTDAREAIALLKPIHGRTRDIASASLATRAAHAIAADPAFHEDAQWLISIGYRHPDFISAIGPHAFVAN